MSWKDLNIKLKAELIKLGVLSGIRDIKLIRLLYDDINTPTLVLDLSYNETNIRPLLGIERIKQDYGITEEEINKTNDIIQLIEKEISLEEINNQLPVLFRLFKNGGYKDNPPFILRIVNNDRRSVKDWQNNNYQSTHKLSYALTPEGYIVYPEVLEVNGLLHDFTDPKYKHGKWDALDNAIRNRDTLRFSTELDALRYTQKYKQKYPEYFKLFNKGGYISNSPTLSHSGGGPIKRKRENSLDWRMAVYNAVDPRTTVKNIDDAFRLYNAAVTKEKRGEDFKDYTLDNTIGDLTTDAAWRKRLLLPYDETLLPVWNGDTVSLSRPLELEIPIDTNLVKDRINYAKDEFWNDVKSLNLRQLKEDLSYKKSQEELLDALRYTYKTGKPIGVSEYHANSIDPEKVLKDFKYGISPLNVLGRYNIRYDKDENKMYYSDEWDFNLYERAVPGTTFRIRGAIPLDNKNEGKVKKYSKGGYENPDEPPVSKSTYALQPPLSIYELELLNYLLSNPTAEQEYFRNLAVLNMTAPQSNLGVILTKEEQDLVDKAILGYNNFRYSHPWAEGLSYTHIIGDGMDLISLAGDFNNKNYINAGLGLGMLALPNFILKPLLKYGKLLNIPDEVWDNLYNKAIKNDNLEEVLQLRDLHFKAKAPNTKIVDADGNPLTTTHGTNKEFNIFELEGPNITHGDLGDFGYGHYFFPDKRISSYGDRQIYAYLNIENPYDGDWNRNFNRGKSGIDYTRKAMKEARDYNLTKMTDSEIESELFRLANADGVTAISPYSNRIQEIVVPKSNQIKLGDAITYADDGTIIPLSKRDNFNNPDIRYSWLMPAIPFGLMSYKPSNQNNKE